MGRPDLRQDWVSVVHDLRRAARVDVIPFGSNMNLALCEVEGFGVAYVLRDADGHQETDLQGVQVTLAVLDTHGTDLLFWSVCTGLPQEVYGAAGIFMGRCFVKDFCPNAKVLVRVTVAWLDGSVWGEIPLGVERPVLCPIPSSWHGLVGLVSPGMRFFSGNDVRIALDVGGAELEMVGFSIRLILVKGFEFVGFRSNYSASTRIVQREFLVDGNISRSEAGPLGYLTLRLTGDREGLIPAIRVVDFRVRTLQKTVFDVHVRLQGFVCGSGRILSVLVHRQKITALVAQTSHPVVVSWNGFQPDTPDLTVASVAVVGIWNRLGLMSVPTETSCSSSTPSLLNVLSCAFLRALPTTVGGVVNVVVSTEGVRTVVSLPVLAVANYSVITVAGLDGVSGRFKVLARFRLGNEHDFFHGDFDVTPYLYGLPSSGVVLNGEEWRCDLSAETFTVGDPALFGGDCIARNYAGSSSAFLFSGGEKGLGSFSFRPSILQPSTPTSTLLTLSSDGGLPLPLVVWGGDPDRLDIDRRNGRVFLLRSGMTPACVSLGGSARVPVVPASIVGLRVVLSATALATLHDSWGFMPTLARVMEARIDLTDGGWMNVTEDDRLRWDSSDGLTVIPGVGFESGNVSGNFTVRFSFEGAPCLSAEVLVSVYAYSMRSSHLACGECGPWLSLQGRPLEGLYPPTEIPVSAFVVTYVLMDGSVVNRSVPLLVDGPGYIRDGFLYGSEPGLLTISVAETQGEVRITVIERWLTSYLPVCNGLACDGSEGPVRLAPFGDGAVMPPFAYPSVLHVTVRLFLFDGTRMDSPLLQGMDLWVNDTYGNVPLVFGDLRLRVSLDRMYRLADWMRVMHVARLERLLVSGPKTLYQIHCSRVWERAAYVASGFLSDGENSTELQALWISDDVVIRGGVPGTFFAVSVGRGWIRAEWGDIFSAIGVVATRTSKLFTAVRFASVPPVWAGRIGERMKLVEGLDPVIDSMGAGVVEERVLFWRSSREGVVRFTNDSVGMILLSGYPIPLQMSGVLRECAHVEAVITTFQLSVNVRPSVDGQIDLGSDVGFPFNESRVGDVLDIPVYLFAEHWLREYAIEIVFDNVSLLPLDCVAVQNQCVLSSRFEVSGSVLGNNVSGRVLVAVLRGRAALSTFSQIYVILRRVLVVSRISKTASLIPTSMFRFALALGRPDPLGFLEPLFDWMGPVTGVSHPPSFPDPPIQLRVCCSTTVAGSSPFLVPHFQSNFELSYIALDPGNVILHTDDPRLRFFYDESLLEYGNGSWTPVGVWADGVARMHVVYTHPGGLRLAENVTVRLGEVERLRLTSDLLEIKRVHCSSSVFQNATVRGELVLVRGMGVLPLLGSSVTRVWLDDPRVARFISVAPDGLILLQGLSVGVTVLRVSAGALEVHARVIVLDESVVFASYSLPGQIHFAGCSGETPRIPVNGTLWDGTVFTHLASFVPLEVHVQGPLRVKDGRSLVLYESGYGGHLSIHISSCQGSPQVTLQADFSVHLTSCIDPFVQPADVELLVENSSVGLLSLVGDQISSFFVYGSTGSVSCQVLTATSDCRVDALGRLLLAGVFPQPVDRVTVASLTPAPELFWGFVEVFSSAGVVRVPIVSGRVGVMPCADPVKFLMPELPFFDTGSLSRSDNPDFILRLMTDRARLVVPHFFSNERELSLMFKVTDRFGLPDLGKARVSVILPESSGVQLLPGGTLEQDGSQTVPASYMGNGWFALQWAGVVREIRVLLKYSVSTDASLFPDAYAEYVRLGGSFHACPRKADRAAVFQLTYRLYVRRDFERLVPHLICKLHITRRRIGWRPDNATSRWGVLSLSVESFLRMAEVRETLSSGWLDRVVRAESRRILTTLPDVLMYDLGSHELTDPEDDNVTCPKGVYFSANGTYEKLPAHAVAGDDCYGMICIAGYQDRGKVCVPEELPNGIFWICLVFILTGVFLVICLLYCVYLSRSGGVDNTEVPMDQGKDDIFDDVFPSNEWGPQTNEQVLDDYSVMILDDPMRSPVTFGEFRR